MQLFYAPDITTPHYTLSEEESKHAIRVLRLGVGSRIDITNGRGALFECRLVDENPKRCRVEVCSTIDPFEPLPYSLTMGVAPTKSIERFEWFLEKATEIGIDTVVTLISAHSERKTIKFEREQRVITSAMKQSLKAYHPTLIDATPFAKVIGHQPTQPTTQRYIAHCGEPLGTEGKPYLGDVVNPGGSIEILIGPEGDFSPREVELALEQGYREVSLGTQRLRTETAAVVATTIVSMKNQVSYEL